MKILVLYSDIYRLIPWSTLKVCKVVSWSKDLVSEECSHFLNNLKEFSRNKNPAALWPLLGKSTSSILPAHTLWRFVGWHERIESLQVHVFTFLKGSTAPFLRNFVIFWMFHDISWVTRQSFIEKCEIKFLLSFFEHTKRLIYVTGKSTLT